MILIIGISSSLNEFDLQSSELTKKVQRNFNEKHFAHEILT